MSGSRKAANNDAPGSDNRSNSARRNKNPSSTNATSTAPGNSTTLTGTGAASLNPQPNLASSNIPMAEPTADINRSERLYPPPSDTNVRKSKNNNKKAGTMESRLDYAVSFTYHTTIRVLNITETDYFF